MYRKPLWWCMPLRTHVCWSRNALSREWLINAYSICLPSSRCIPMHECISLYFIDIFQCIAQPNTTFA